MFHLCMRKGEKRAGLAGVRIVKCCGVGGSVVIKRVGMHACMDGARDNTGVVHTPHFYFAYYLFIPIIPSLHDMITALLLFISSHLLYFPFPLLLKVS